MSADQCKNKCPRIKRSSNHPTIVGKFAENLVCNWLSRSGFEVAIVRHTGIDLVGYRHGKRLGITVKSRTHTGRKDKHSSVNVLLQGDRKKLSKACGSFGCEPWIAVYVETPGYGDLYLTSLKHYDDAKYTGRRGKVKDDWKMTPDAQEKYNDDKDVYHIHFDFKSTSWWQI